MTEENKDSPEEISAPSTPPVAPSLNPEQGSDIIGAAAEKEKRGSAVLGMVEPSAASREQDSRRGGGGRGRGGRGGPGRGGPGRGGPGGGRGRGGPGGRGRGRRGQQRPQEEDSGLIEKVVNINRCAKVVAGGRRFSFSALVVVGDGEGNVGVGYGKAKEVPECIRKGTEKAKANMKPINRRNNTIPHPVIGEHDGGRVMLRPATPGTGVIAGGGVRAVLEAAGIKDVLTKSLRSNNPLATVNATLDALKQLRSKEQIYALRRG
jgi:small subunit ribosomal protein S5